jgi:hypothetical protein
MLELSGGKPSALNEMLGAAERLDFASAGGSRAAKRLRLE